MPVPFPTKLSATLIQLEYFKAFSTDSGTSDSYQTPGEVLRNQHTGLTPGVCPGAGALASPDAPMPVNLVHAADGPLVLLTVMFLMICCTRMALVSMCVLRGACCSSRRSSWPTTGSSSGPALLTRRLCSISLRTRGRRARTDTQTPQSLSLQSKKDVSERTQAGERPFPHFLRLSSVLLTRNKVFSDKTPQTKTS